MFLEIHNGEEYRVKPGKVKRITIFKVICFLKIFFGESCPGVGLSQIYHAPASASLL